MRYFTSPFHFSIVFCFLSCFLFVPLCFSICIASSFYLIRFIFFCRKREIALLACLFFTYIFCFFLSWYSKDIVFFSCYFVLVIIFEPRTIYIHLCMSAYVCLFISFYPLTFYAYLYCRMYVFICLPVYLHESGA